MSSSAATSDISWMPLTGKHTVNLGTSLRSALRAGQPAPPSKKRSALPSRDFYSVRYRFKPPSLDTTKPGYMNITPRTEDIAATVEHPCAQTSDVHTYVGTELASKDVDCVLIYDEETMTFTLEKLDSSVSLTYDKKGPPTLIRPTASNDAATPPAPQVPTPKQPSPEPQPTQPAASPVARAASVEDNLEMELEAALGGTPEVEEIPMPSIAPEPRPAQRAQSRSKVPRPGKQSKGKATPATPAPTPAPVLSYTVDDDLDQEIFEASSSRVAKRPRISPEVERKPVADSGLALPGPSTAVHYPSSYPGIALPTPSDPPPPPIPVAAEDSDEDEDWEAVAAVTSEPMVPVATSPPRGDAVEDLDFGIFMEEVNQQIGEHVDSDDDFLAAAVDAEPESPVVQKQPISLDEMANREYDEDFSSSDDESDDE